MAKLLKIFGCTRKDPYDSDKDDEENKKFNEKKDSTSPRSPKSTTTTTSSTLAKEKEENSDNVNVSNTVTSSQESPSSPKASSPKPNSDDNIQNTNVESEKEIPPPLPNNSTNETVKDEVHHQPVPVVEPVSKPKETDEFEKLKEDAKKVQDSLPKDDKPAAQVVHAEPKATTGVKNDESKWEKLKEEKLNQDSNPSMKVAPIEEESEDDKWTRLRKEKFDEEEQSV